MYITSQKAFFVPRKGKYNIRFRFFIKIAQVKMQRNCLLTVIFYVLLVFTLSAWTNTVTYGMISGIRKGTYKEIAKPQVQ